MAKIALFFILLSSFYGTEVDQIEGIFPLINEQTWVLFDIDSDLPEPEIISRVQQAAGAVFGLTAHGPPVDATILQQLTQIGLKYTFNSPLRPNLEKKSPDHWDGGVVSISDFSGKMEVFRKWLDMAQFRPSNIVIIHSGNQNLSEMEGQAKELNIPFHFFHFENP